MAVIYLAGGCFWGIQGYFSRVDGVVDSTAGYANSYIAQPSYEIVCSGRSGAVEAVEIVYDECRLSLDEIIARLLDIIDPCALNYQGNDIGSQYRNGVYFLPHNQAHDEPIITNRVRLWEQAAQARQKQETQNTSPIKAVTEIMALENFTRAEEYHQQYLRANPRGYCHIDIDSALLRFVYDNGEISKGETHDKKGENATLS